MKFKAHINVEIVASVAGLKYLFKYVRKGVENSKSPSKKKPAENEVNNFINARYIGASEALWRIMGLHMHEMSPSVAKLPIHLPDGHLAFVEIIDTKNKTQAEIDAAREAQKAAIM